jgi:hypothetical protein
MATNYETLLVTNENGITTITFNRRRSATR